MALDLVYFAWVREAIGLPGERVDPPAEVRDVAGLIAWLAERSRGHREALRDPGRLRAAIDQRFVDLNALLDGAREVAIFPPVTGG